MRIDIDQEALNAHVSKSVASALQHGAESWEVREQVSEAATKAIVDANLPAMLHDALRTAVADHAEQVVADICAESVGVLRAAMSDALRASFTAMAYGALTGKPSYLHGSDAEQWAAAERLVRDRQRGPDVVSDGLVALHNGELVANDD